ncbi:hypothetical protein LZK77_05910 [Rhizobium leguminosarum]|nr:hypothetical protein LZK77_05910 [Rhizobium leguminosarum]UIY25266.1 hypothetical protein LZK76_06020 [Rhizobium leguminosarum]
MNADPLGDVHDMRRGISPDGEPRTRKTRFDQGASRAFALGACHMDDTEAVLGIAKPTSEIAHRLQIDPHIAARPALPIRELIKFG